MSTEAAIQGNPADKTNKVAVAIFGSGVAGLSAAWHLHQNGGDRYEIHVFESEDRLGGHACTTAVATASGESVDVDIGFMVFNHSNYPNMVKWFQELGVAEENSDMSLSVSLDGGHSVEWSSDGLNGLFAKRSQIISPTFYQYLREMLRFNDQAVNSLLHLPADDPRRAVTTAQYLREQGYSPAFATYYLLPMMAALWSASIEDVLQFPAEQLLAFLANHKMLQLFERPQVCNQRELKMSALCAFLLLQHA
jgi:cyclopropane-fatty-acyl-phospholipid synthase